MRLMGVNSPYCISSEKRGAQQLEQWAKSSCILKQFADCSRRNLHNNLKVEQNAAVGSRVGRIACSSGEVRRRSC
jgi:hypothetical protein